jgi:hypothetical protein
MYLKKEVTKMEPEAGYMLSEAPGTGVLYVTSQLSLYTLLLLKLKNVLILLLI